MRTDHTGRWDLKVDAYLRKHPEAKSLSEDELEPLVEQDIARMKAEHDARIRQELLGDLRRRNQERLNKRPRLYREAVADDPEVLKWIDSYCALFPSDTRKMLIARARGNSLFLYGNPGTGKTFQALGIPAVVAARDMPAGFLFIRAVDYLDGQQNADFRDKEALYQEALGAQLLIIDDLFAGGDHKRSTSDLYRLLDARFIDERPTVMTCNLSGPALLEAMGERLVDRLRESAVYVKLAGNSRRKFRAITAPASPEQRTDSAPSGWWDN